jgi:hypothetical protein
MKESAGQFYNGLTADEVVDSAGVGHASAFEKPERNGIHGQSQLVASVGLW